MKNLSIILALFTGLQMSAQVPAKVEQFMQDSAGAANPIDTIYYGNRQYVFNVKSDTFLTRWELIKSDRLYFDGWKAAGVTYFFTSWSAFFIVPKIWQSGHGWEYHAIAGSLISIGVNVLVYKWTGKKWLALPAAIVAAWLAGIAKETRDKLIGGTFSKQDVLWTGIPGTYLGLGTTITIGNLHKPNRKVSRTFTNPFKN